MMTDEDRGGARVDPEWSGRSVLVLGIVALVCALGIVALCLHPSLGIGSLLLVAQLVVGSVSGGLALLIARTMRHDGGAAARLRSRIGVALALVSGVGVAALVAAVIVAMVTLR